jgi:DNA-binding NarL/FixJ family response regulator
MKKTRIFIADGHPVVLSGIRNILSGHLEFEIVGETSSGRDVLRLIEAFRPDIVVMDSCMRNLDGTEVVRQIKKFDPGIRVIIFSMYRNHEYVVDFLKIYNISGYILKEDPTPELVLALRAARDGRSHFSKAISPLLSKSMKDLGRIKRAQAGIGRLTLREREVLRFLAEGHSIRKIAENLHLSPKTVESHKYNIMGKLGHSNLPRLTCDAIRMKIIDL